MAAQIQVPSWAVVGSKVSAPPPSIGNRSPSPPSGLVRLPSTTSLSPSSSKGMSSVQLPNSPSLSRPGASSVHKKTSSTPSSRFAASTSPPSPPKIQNREPLKSSFHLPSQILAPKSSQIDGTAAAATGQPSRRSSRSTTIYSQGSGTCSPPSTSPSQFSIGPQSQHSQQSISRAASTPSTSALASLPNLLQALHGEADNTIVKLPHKACVSKPTEDNAEVVDKARVIFDMIDGPRRSFITKLDLVKVVAQNAEVRNFVLSDIDKVDPEYERIFDETISMFKKIAQGKKHINKNEFASFFQQEAQNDAGSCNSSAHSSALTHAGGLSHRLQQAFTLIDSDGDGIVSRFDLLGAVNREPSVSSIVFPGTDLEMVVQNSCILDAVDAVFNKISHGRKRIECNDFLKYFLVNQRSTTPRARALVRAQYGIQRHAYRVLVIAPGFGQQLNPHQCQLVEQSGFRIEWLHLPNPETPGFALGQHLGTLKSAIDRCQPHLLAAASKGGHYIIASWATGLWRGPTLLLNSHPSLRELPKNVPIVIAHGLNDELYPRSRADLEQLISTGSPNMCFLYTTVDSGKVGAVSTRKSDGHNMDSLLVQDCLPRLMDATLSLAPEMYMMWSWRQKLGQQRLEAEEWLGYSPDDLRRFWVSAEHRGLDSQKLYEVPYGCEEYQKVAAVFLASPKEQAFYRGMCDAIWQNTGIVRIERIENGLQEAGSAQPYYESLRKSIEDQGLSFEPGLHTRWAFHGTSAIESIVNNPMAGFQPLMSGTRLGSVWGDGTYFARDAKYVVDSNFCQPAEDGTRKMLMCLIMTGMSCVGSPDHHGMLPVRQEPHRFNSSVDSLSSPEIYIMQHPSSAHPAYAVTFRTYL